MDDPNLRQGMYLLAFMQGDPTGMQEQQAWAAGKPGVEDYFLTMQADTEAYFGRRDRTLQVLAGTLQFSVLGSRFSVSGRLLFRWRREVPHKA